MSVDVVALTRQAGEPMYVDDGQSSLRINPGFSVSIGPAECRLSTQCGPSAHHRERLTSAVSGYPLAYTADAG